MRHGSSLTELELEDKGSKRRAARQGQCAVLRETEPERSSSNTLHTRVMAQKVSAAVICIPVTFLEIGATAQILGRVVQEGQSSGK